jgi:hypothetical protein
MIVTNKYNLPESVVRAVSRNYPPKENRISVTDLVNAPLIRYLKMKHWDDLTEDASDQLWKLLGTSMHYVLEQHSPEDAFQEEKLTADINGITISGKSDLYQNGVITDWKATSVFSFLLGNKPEWEAQLNVYAWLWKMNGFPVEKLLINALLRDWQKSKSLQDSNYPRIPFLEMEIPLWSTEDVKKYILYRVSLHMLVPPPECTPEEKWQRPTTYAVMKKGRKSAVRVYNSDLEAEMKIDSIVKEKSKHYIEKRPGRRIRCEDYCIVNKFCPYYKGVIN